VKVGFIVECGPQGAETAVIPHLARMILPAVVTDVVPLDVKTKLKQECGRWAAELLGRGCAKVLITWDLLPAWGEYEGVGCRHDDKEEIYQSLQNAGIRRTDRRVRLICIEKMLEAWLRADERALQALLSTDAHAANVPRHRSTETIRDPKAALNTVFRQHGVRYRRYVDRDHAIQIARQLPDLGRLRRCATFRRFEEKLQ
jgi:hypothetical protein